MVSTPWCPACLKFFWTRERVVHHLRRARKCLARVREHAPRMPPEQASRLDREAAPEQSANLRAGFPHRFAAAPCIQALGPLPAWAYE